MSQGFQGLFAWLGQFGVTIVAAAAVAYGLFRFLGKKWIEGLYAKQLVALKAAADRELEAFRVEKSEQRDALTRDFQRESDRLKAEISRLADRASQLHRREYEILPEAWGLLNKAFGRACESARSGAIYPHFDQNDPAALAHFIDGEDLADYQKAQLKASPSWYDDYTKMRQNKAVLDARVLIGDFNNFIILNGVFLEEPLVSKMREAKEVIASANEKRWAVLDEINELGDEAQMKKDLAVAGQLIDEIKGMVRAKLFTTQLGTS